MKSEKRNQLGIISDTHGLLRPEAIHALIGVELIIHAGDIDTPEVLRELETIAPVVAVRGNMDKGEWADRLSKTELVEIGGITIYALHDIQQLDLDPRAAGVDVVVNGHTHRPLIQDIDGVIYFNPGSAGYRRNSAPLGVGILTLEAGGIKTKLIEID